MKFMFRTLMLLSVLASAVAGLKAMANVTAEGQAEQPYCATCAQGAAARQAKAVEDAAKAGQGGDQKNVQSANAHQGQ